MPDSGIAVKGAHRPAPAELGLEAESGERHGKQDLLKLRGAAGGKLCWEGMPRKAAPGPAGSV